MLLLGLPAFILERKFILGNMSQWIEMYLNKGVATDRPQDCAEAKTRQYQWLYVRGWRLEWCGHIAHFIFEPCCD